MYSVADCSLIYELFLMLRLAALENGKACPCAPFVSLGMRAQVHAAGPPRPAIHPMPQTPLFLLRQLVGHIKVCTMKLLYCLLLIAHALHHRSWSTFAVSLLCIDCTTLPTKPAKVATPSAKQVLVEQLRHMCLEEKVGRDGPAGRGYNALTQSAKEWTLEPSKPCSGERLLLMFDRWCAYCMAVQWWPLCMLPLKVTVRFQMT